MRVPALLAYAGLAAAAPTPAVNIGSAKQLLVDDTLLE